MSGRPRFVRDTVRGRQSSPGVMIGRSGSLISGDESEGERKLAIRFLSRLIQGRVSAAMSFAATTVTGSGQSPKFILCSLGS